MSTIKDIWIIGAGKMGQALYHGWTRAAEISVGPITLIDPSPQPTDLVLRPGDRWISGLSNNAAAQPDMLVLAVKPQIMAEIVPVYAGFLKPNTLVLSIAAGVSVAQLAQLCGRQDQPIIRAMPNTPAMIGQGMTAGFANPHVSNAQRDMAAKLFQAVGHYVALADEDQMHAVTAVSGSGPAYLFALIEAMSLAAQQADLPASMAAQLARQTVIGAAALAADQAAIDPAILRQNVTSPNGTTAAGLAVLQADPHGLNDLMVRTIAAAANRSRDLGQTS